MNTMQQEFDAVAEHLHKQGRPAKDGFQCRYRSNDGLMCAVGCRIPDELYDVDMESRNAGYLIQGAGEGVYNLPPELPAYEKLFTALQGVHDGWTSIINGIYDKDYLDEKLQEVAIDFGLTYKSPYEVK